MYSKNKENNKKVPSMWRDTFGRISDSLSFGAVLIYRKSPNTFLGTLHASEYQADLT